MSNNFLYKYLSLIVVAFKDIVYIFYYEIHLKYCQDTDIYWYIDNLLQQWKTILRSLGKTEKSFSHILTDYCHTFLILQFLLNYLIENKYITFYSLSYAHAFIFSLYWFLWFPRAKQGFLIWYRGRNTSLIHNSSDHTTEPIKFTHVLLLELKLCTVTV